MKTAEERFNELTLMSDTVHKGDVVNIMHEYALEVAEQALMDAARNAKIIKTGNSGSYYDASVDKDSILNTKITTP